MIRGDTVEDAVRGGFREILPLVLRLVVVGMLATTASAAPVDALESAKVTLNRNDDGQVVEVLYHHHSDLSEAGLRQLAGLKHLKRLGLTTPRLTNDHLLHLADLGGLESLGLSQAQITDEGLEHLVRLTALRTLQLDGCRAVTDAGLARLAGLKSLVELNLGETAVTLAGLKQLAGRRLRVLGLPEELYVDECLSAYLRALDTQVDLDLSNWSLTDDGMPHLASQHQLKSLVLPGGWRQTKLISDHGLVHLAGLDQLETLSLAEADIDGSGLRHLRGLASLKSLDLAGTRLIDEHMHHVGDLERLEFLRLSYCQEITDAGLEPLAQLTRLKHLNLGVYPGNSKLTDAGLAHLSGLTNLRELYLTDMPVTAVGLRHLESLAVLELLWLGGCMKVTDEGLASVVAIDSLKWVNLNDTEVTGAGVLMLQQLRPSCKVSHGVSITWMHINGWWFRPTAVTAPLLLLSLAGSWLLRRRRAARGCPSVSELVKPEGGDSA